MKRSPASDLVLFLLGGSLFAAGLFLFFNQVMVSGEGMGLGWPRWGGGLGNRGSRWGGGYRSGGFGLQSLGGFWPGGSGDGMGLLMIPLALGFVLLFAGRFRRIAWLLVWGSGAALTAGILHSLSLRFLPTTLWALITMVVLMAAGGGLMLRSLSGSDPDPDESEHGHDS